MDQRAIYSVLSAPSKICLPTCYGHDCGSRVEFSIRTDVFRSDLRVGTGMRSVRERQHRILYSFVSLWTHFRKARRLQRQIAKKESTFCALKRLHRARDADAMIQRI